MQIITHSITQTHYLGIKLGKRLMAGSVVLLYGQMGTGKSELARGIAKGLGIQGPIPSPTFTIMQMYTDGRIPLYHFDWYRLSDQDELYEMGLDEYLESDGVALIEWPVRAIEAIPDKHLAVTIQYLEDENTRLVKIESCGGFELLKGGELDEPFGD